MKAGFLPSERACAICGKHFIARDEYVYVRGYDHWKKYFCSYSCLKAYDKSKDKPKEKDNTRKEKILQLRKEGLSRRKIAEQLGISEDCVEYYDVRYGGL